MTRHLAALPSNVIASRRRLMGWNAQRHGSPTAAASVLSLDVFGTVLTRASGSSTSLYLMLGNRLRTRQMISCSPEVFARTRVRAELDVLQREGGLAAPISIADFYEEIAKRLGLDDARIPEFISAEEELESHVLRDVPENRRLVEEFESMGKPLVFLSDTYRPSEFIRSELKYRRLFPEASLVMTSTESNASKVEGQLFVEVLRSLEIPPEEMLHVGDSQLSDHQVPRRFGVATRPFPDGRLNRFEALLAEHKWDTGALSASFAGASRLARLNTPVASQREQSIRDVAAGVAAPLLVGYVLWLLGRAQRMGLSRLYFVARDGQIMADIATQLVERLEMQLDIAYLYASRDSVNLAATYELSEQELAWVVRDSKHLTPKEILECFDISWEEARSRGLAEHLDRTLADAASSGQEALAALQASGELRDLVLERAAERRALVLHYLSQEGLLDGTPSGIVDFGGMGSQMRALHTLVSEAGGVPPRVFLMGLDRPEDAGLRTPSDEPPWLRDTECYLYDHRRGRGIRRARGFGTCVQMFCAADHGTCVGYAMEGALTVPVLSEPTDQALANWGLPLFRRTVAGFVEHVLLDEDLVELEADVRAVSTALVDSFWSRPTREDALAWGSFPFEGAQATGTTRAPLAHRYGWREVLRGIPAGTFPNLGWMHWYEASLRLSSPAVVLPLRLLERLYRSLEGMRSPLGRRVVALVRRALKRPPEAG